MSIEDSLGRPLRDLRISITDRCNFRCTYCMPRENFGPDHTFLAKQEILSYEEMTTVVESLLPLGLKKVRITGGEPLMRKDLGIFIAMLRSLDAEIDIALTTNGVLLKKHARQLFDSGLNRVTVSIDAMDVEMFQSITDSKNTPGEVFAGIETAQQCGLRVKVNCVVKKGLNEEQIVPLVDACSSRNIPIRFIEFMDVGTTNNWNLESVVSGEEMRQRISNHYGPLRRNTAKHPSDVARMWSLKNGTEVGFIESVSSPFCGDCSRARLSAHGSMYTCLFSEKGFDIRGILRFGASSQEVAELIQNIWTKRDDRYSEIRGQVNTERQPVEMSFIGG
ncbi:GTP 3',8-cyclase MoaA [Candidatus Poseidoniaceae archaeon]|nr:GTP 3',8-cyclase MoaA [Euryarchaeota archaeon]MDA8842821.1 GTP 3',8-cyclase MoaA [Euryarchaeota archaeon]MDA9828408.1 GTP 3',8-cyclase MoaA [Candidatus Poseidoniaceae archaeon]MDB2593211.1 GTP 3',8-cyclase MoaA [Euryarchaeota archaeon]MDC0655611.1 GTP 3',8-cyclase MoaA [Candidatus Poseidoniaceae archaeon]